MQNPKAEITAIVTTLTSTKSNSELVDTISKYFTPDAQFVHLICVAGSRAEILWIYQWYRIMSPETKCDVENIIYDRDLNVIVLDMVQWFSPRFRFSSPAPARLNTRLTLLENDRLHYIARQEDFYPTMDFFALLSPYLVPFVWVFLKLTSLVSNLLARFFLRAGALKGGGTGLKARGE
ncbi:hypothetical protein PAXRUDRAFT_23402 [Paxillus rubicundulus Ve08.2h10]|uniref:SigF-like NTF2-like domain-containing protein n=1 Tax=Paxillus rubicundulus Ve08.2h10 TaxID=930991 RepID=A0A0D0E5U8_9AGAM|nr:hypothetical protein PAXRUDRAFT_23402 [Paxillus rubicundulus Ve08.2h10]